MDIDQDNSEPEPEKIDLWTDLLLSFWVLVVACAYYGPAINANWGRLPILLAPMYAVMVLLTVLSVSLRVSKKRQASRQNLTQKSDSAE